MYRSFVAVVICCLAGQAIGQTVTWQTLGVTGESAPGSEWEFRRFSLPTVNNRGMIAFHALQTLGPSGIWVFPATPGPSEEPLLFGLGQRQPITGGLPGDVWDPPARPMVDDGGRVLGRAGGVDKPMLTLATRDRFHALARRHLVPPGGSEPVTTIPTDFAHSAEGLAAFSLDGGSWIWRAEKDEIHPWVLWGQELPQLPGAVIEHVASPAMNERGNLVAVGGFARWTGPIVQDTAFVVLGSVIGGEPALVLREGDDLHPPALSTDEYFYGRSWGTAVSLNNHGDVALHTIAHPVASPGAQSEGVVVGNVSDPRSFTLIAAEFEQLPGMQPGERIWQHGAFDDPHIDHWGRVTFSVRIKDVGFAAYRGKRHALRLLGRPGEPFPLLGPDVELLGMGPLRTANARGVLIITGWVAGPGITTENDGLLLAMGPRDDSEPRLLLREGDEFTVRPGDVRTLERWEMLEVRGGENSIVNGLSDDGTLAMVVHFTDDSSAVIATRLDFPEHCPADCDGDGTADLFDFLCFQNRFVASDPYGDCDGDGAFTFLDLLCYQDAFIAGCPQ